MKTPLRCASCRKKFKPNPRSKNQNYCGNAFCQKARKRQWQREKMRSDPDYKENQRQAAKTWREKNPDYSKSYRASNSDYVRRNREAQKRRNSKSRMIAKMDALSKEYEIKPGLYKIYGPSLDGVAKMDALMHEIFIIPERYKLKAHDCKKGHDRPEPPIPINWMKGGDP